MNRALKRFLGNTPAFILACLLLASFTGVLVYLFRADLAEVARVVLRRPDERAQVWQRWATHYAGLFGMLPYPARIGIQHEDERSSGVLIEKTANGFRAETRASLASARPGVVFILDDRARSQLLDGFERRKPVEIWALVKDNLYTGHIRIWHDPDTDMLLRGGYLRLMRDIDTRPDALPWEAVKQKLGESPK